MVEILSGANFRSNQINLLEKVAYQPAGFRTSPPHSHIVPKEENVPAIKGALLKLFELAVWWAPALLHCDLTMLRLVVSGFITLIVTFFFPASP